MSGRAGTFEYHRAQIRTFLRFRECTVADAGKLTAWELAALLDHRGDLDELRAQADAGDWLAALQLAALLAEQGRGEEVERLRRFGLNPDGSIADA